MTDPPLPQTRIPSRAPRRSSRACSAIPTPKLPATDHHVVPLAALRVQIPTTPKPGSHNGAAGVIHARVPTNGRTAHCPRGRLDCPTIETPVSSRLSLSYVTPSRPQQLVVFPPKIRGRRIKLAQEYCRGCFVGITGQSGGIARSCGLLHRSTPGSNSVPGIRCRRRGRESGDRDQARDYRGNGAVITTSVYRIRAHRLGESETKLRA